MYFSFLIAMARTSSITLNKKGEEREDGGEIGGSGVNFPLRLGETPTHSTEKQSEQPKAAQRL